MWLADIIHASWVAAGTIGFLEALARLRSTERLHRLPAWLWETADMVWVFAVLCGWKLYIDGISILLLPVAAALLLYIHHPPRNRRGLRWQVGILVILQGMAEFLPVFQWPNPLASKVLLLAMTAAVAGLGLVRAPAVLILVAPGCEVAVAALLGTAGAMAWSEIVTGAVAALLFVMYGYERIRREQVMREGGLDQLTGVLNRRGAQTWIRQHAGRPVTAVMVDLDDFKFVNDTFGHDVGDMLLQETARRLGECVRSEDAVVRWGGDEFLVLVLTPEVPAHPEEIARRIHARLTGEPVYVHGLPEKLTLGASVGVAAGPLELTLLQHADQALLRVKQSTKNDVSLWRPVDVVPAYGGEYVETGQHVNWAVQALRTVMRNSPVGFVVTAADHTILDVNPAFERMTGYARSELIGQKPKVLAANATDNAELYSQLRTHLARYGSWQGMFENRRADGTRWTAWEHISAMEVGGRVIGYCSVVLPVDPALLHAHEVAAAAREEPQLAVNAAFLAALAHIAEWGIPGLPEHVRRVQAYVRWLAELAAERGLLPASEVDLIAFASVAHDIGKAAVAREILLKPAALTPSEYAYIQNHAESGRVMLLDVFAEWMQACSRPAERLFAYAVDIAWTHHERWDGTGYPRRLSGTDIPIAGRITAIADVLDALLSKRPYKDAWSSEEVYAYFAEQRGRQFDPHLVDLLLQHWEQRPFVAAQQQQMTSSA